MKKVVSFFAVAAALLIAGSAQAQLGINVGYAPETTTSVLTIGNTSTKSTDVMNGFFAGVNYNINVSGDLNFSVGLQARYNTNSSEDKVSTVTTKTNRTKIMADIPLLFNYGIRVGNDARLSVFLGPTVSYALQGKITTTVSESITGANTVKSSSMYALAYRELRGDSYLSTMSGCSSLCGIKSSEGDQPRKIYASLSGPTET